MDHITQWKALAAATLSRQHGIDATKIPEGLWNQLYVSGYTPREAANHARVHYDDALPSVAHRVQRAAVTQ